MERLKNKVALVTGASRGIGRGIALCLAEDGADILVNYRSQRQEAEEVARLVENMGRRAMIWQADVADRDSQKKMFEAAEAEFGAIDIAIANAGINFPGLVIDLNWEDARRIFEVSMFGVFHTCQFAAQHMVAQNKLVQRGGKIVIISSIHEEMAVPASAPYNMCKAGINHLARTLALELAPYHINVNSINPGRIDTPSTRSFFEDEEDLQRANQHIPWRRVGTSEEIGKAVAYLCSADADYITGSNLRIDGGFAINLNLSMDDLYDKNPEDEHARKEAKMIGGYAGKFLWVDLNSGQIKEEIPAENLLRDFMGGYGVAARVLYDLIPAGADPLGPENVLAVITGPLTGTVAPTATRWTVAAKSPLTGGWGDANGSGFFGPAMKRAGVDAVFFTGISDKPVYLLIADGKAELRDAAQLWGMDTYEVEDWVQSDLGKGYEAICIGPAGEKLSLISGVIHKKGRAAARSGLGAVMGSKRLKMIAALGSRDVEVADKERVKAVRKKYAKQISDGVGSAKFYSVTGTPGYTPMGAKNGDSPTKNWGSSTDHFQDPDNLSFDKLLKYRNKKEACWRCPIACWGTSKCVYEDKTIEAHQPEYETASAFGSMTLNDNYPSLIASNDICNRYGLDTISAGGCLSFAIECFENGLIDLEATGGIELRWGNHAAMNRMLEQLAFRQGFGDVLADGVKIAAEKVGEASLPFAIHVGGQELPMHDPRFEPGLGVIYQIDATPGRHTQAGQYNNPPGYPSEMPPYGDRREEQIGRGKFVKEAACLVHTMNSAGLCLFGFFSTEYTYMPEMLSAVTGWEITIEDVVRIGERIANIRQAFNVREGINAVNIALPERAYGRPPLPDGATAGIRVEVEVMLSEHLENMGWTSDAAVPQPETLERLGLADIASDLWK